MDQVTSTTEEVVVENQPEVVASGHHRDIQVKIVNKFSFLFLHA